MPMMLFSDDASMFLVSFEVQTVSCILNVQYSLSDVGEITGIVLV